MRNLLIALFTLLSFTLSAQIIRTVGIVYTGSLPTHIPSTQGAWVAIDTLTGQWYERDNTAGIWREMGARLQATNTTGVPSYTPSKQRGRLAINSGDSLYYYQAGTWTHINAGGGGGTDDQQLSIDSVGRFITVTLEDGGAVTFEDRDRQVIDTFGVTIVAGPEPLNELRLSISNDGQLYKAVNMMPYLDNTDNQTLSIDSTAVTGGRRFTVSIEDGNSVSFIDSIGSGGGGGDDWGSQVVEIAYGLNGDGTTGNELEVDTLEIATAFSLVDSAAAIRGDIPDVSVYVEYSDSITTFVTPDMLNDTSIAIRADFPINTDDQAISIDSVGRIFTITLEDGGNVVFEDLNTTYDLSPYVEYADSLTTFVTPTMLNDTATAIRGDFPINTDNQTIDTFAIVSNTLRISNESDNEPFKSVDLTPYLDNTDNQTLSIDSVAVTGGRRFTVNIQNGNSVSFIDSIADGGSVNTDSTTVLFQDSILIYYTLNGAEYDRDTIRIAGGGGGGVSGSGTTNYASKWTGATSQGNSQIFDNGTNVGIRNTSPVSGLHLSKTLGVNTGEFMTVSDVTSGNSVKMGLYYLSGFNRYPGIWLNQATPNTANYAFLFDPDADRTLFNAPAGGLITFRIGNNTGAGAMTIGPTGKLFIGGQTDPFSTLLVKSKGSTSATGAFQVSNSSNANLIYMSDAGDFTVYNQIRLGSQTGPMIRSGTGSPESVVTAPVGSMFLRTNGGAGTTLYIKESGAGNTGWRRHGSGIASVDAGATLTLEYGNDYFFSGTTATWTLPAINANIAGRDNSITIKNRGTGNLTVNTDGGLNTMFTTALTNTIILSVGDAVVLMPDGTILNIE